MKISELLTRIDDAIAEEDIQALQRSLADLREAIERREKHIEELEAQLQALQGEVRDLRQQTAWRWLRNNEPESYEQLLDKLDLARSTGTTRNHKYEFSSLIDIFSRCQQLQIPLNSLETPEHLGKYREAIAHLRGLDGEDLKQALQEVQADANREETRDRVRQHN